MRYKSEYCQKLLSHFRCSEALPLPSLLKFAQQLGASPGDLLEWKRQHPEFESALEEAKLCLLDRLIDGALEKTYDASFIKYLLSEPTLFWYFGGAEDSRESALSVEVKVMP